MTLGSEAPDLGSWTVGPVTRTGGDIKIMRMKAVEEEMEVKGRRSNGEEVR